MQQGDEPQATDPSDALRGRRARWWWAIGALAVSVATIVVGTCVGLRDGAARGIASGTGAGLLTLLVGIGSLHRSFMRRIGAPFEVGAVVMMTGGPHAGRIGVVRRVPTHETRSFTIELHGGPTFQHGTLEHIRRASPTELTAGTPE